MRNAVRCAAGVLCLLACLAVAPALAADLDGVKAAGQVGERPDGYLGLVSAGAPADVQALVKDINAQRKAKYAQIAQSNSIPLDAVAARAGAKLVERAPSGQYVMSTSGVWSKKP